MIWPFAGKCTLNEDVDVDAGGEFPTNQDLYSPSKLL